MVERTKALRKKLLAKTKIKTLILIELKLIYFITAAFVYIGDIMTKKMALAFNESGIERFEIIPDFLEFSYSENLGMAAGMFSESRLLFIVPSVILMSLIVIYLILDNGWNPGIGVAVSMVLGGGIGNMTERFSGDGSVVDFIFVVPFNFFPFDCVFNIADIFVCVGGGLFLYEVIKLMICDEKKKLFGEAESTHIDMPRWLTKLSEIMELCDKKLFGKKNSKKSEENNDGEAEDL